MQSLPLCHRRCLRLPIWHDGALGAERAVLEATVDRCIALYDRNLDQFNIPPGMWAKVRRWRSSRLGIKQR